MELSKLVKNARINSLHTFHAAELIGGKENWKKRFLIEAFGPEVAAELDALSPQEAAKLRAEAVKLFESLLTDDDRARIEAAKKDRESDATDIESESLGAEGETILNLTPHTVTVVDDNGKIVAEFKPEPVSARLSTKTARTGKTVAGIPLSKTVFGEPVGLPEKRPGVFLIVSAIFKTALPDRDDLLIPNETVRDAAGRIIGCKSFA